MISNWSSNAMYNGELTAHKDVRHRQISDIYEGIPEEFVDEPLLFIDTAGALMYEGVDE